jgi:membrane protease YdiL (CAAX protease family)
MEAVEVEAEDYENDQDEPGPGTQEEMMKNPKWNGIPPVGNRPIYDRWKFLLMILLVFGVKIMIWGIYRYTTGTLDFFTNPDNGREMTYWVGMVAKPVLQLTPVFILWAFLFRERGLPFRFTKKHLFSSIIFGCILGFIYYFVATGVMISVFELSGHGTDFHFVAGWDDVGWWLIIAMMFSYMIGTGPTEEIFSRGFIQDQSARAFPLRFAILFTAVLFAAGHLPISILVYHLSFMTIVWYMIILVVMSCFFSIIYQWSRNIVFPAIIHGLWDWYLSLFALRGAYSAWFMTDPDVNFGPIDFISTLITLAIMLPIFYIVYLVWWKHDKPLVDGPLAGIVQSIENISFTDKIRELDRGWWPRRNPILVTAAIVGMFCLASIPVAAWIGTDDPSKFTDRMIEETSREYLIWENNTTFESDELNVDESTEYYIDINEKEIHFINITLEWTDEPPDNQFFVNKPDSFKLEFFDPEGNELALFESDVGIIRSIWPGENNITYSGEFLVRVTLTEALDQERELGLGFWTIEDNSNAFKIIMKYESYVRVQSSGDSADVRWQT